LLPIQRGVMLDFSRPGKPTDNAFIESFNGKLRAECQNAHWFMMRVGEGEHVVSDLLAARTPMWCEPDDLPARIGAEERGA
jgi:transposase InsO family protein